MALPRPPHLQPAGSPVLCTSSRSYFSGRLRRRSISKVASSASSLPASLRYALVHLTLRGLRFILKFLWHLDRQKRNICSVQCSSKYALPRRPWLKCKLN